jgi:Domain of unknown function (DUF4145)
MPESRGRKTPPSWLGFHRDGLIIVFILDCLWSVIEVGAGATIVGIPAIPFIAFSLFGISSYIVFSKQRALSDSYIQATWKSIFLGAIAGVPFPVFFTMLFFVFAVVNKILPKTKGISVQLPTLDHQSLGKFISDFKEVEELLKVVVQEVDASKVSSKVSENIEFLKSKGMIPTDLAKSLDKIRGARNDAAHSALETPDLGDMRLLKKVKDELEMIFQRR